MGWVCAGKGIPEQLEVRGLVPLSFSMCSQRVGKPPSGPRGVGILTPQLANLTNWANGEASEVFRCRWGHHPSLAVPLRDLGWPPAGTLARADLTSLLGCARPASWHEAGKRFPCGSPTSSPFNPGKRVLPEKVRTQRSLWAVEAGPLATVQAFPSFGLCSASLRATPSSGSLKGTSEPHSCEDSPRRSDEVLSPLPAAAAGKGHPAAQRMTGSHGETAPAV